MNEVIESEGRFFHPSDQPAPRGWARVSGERLPVVGRQGVYCEIRYDQTPFGFRAEGIMVVITEGFRNPSLNGTVVLPLDALRRGDLDEIKGMMKVQGAPSCTRLNLLEDFRLWLAGLLKD